MSMYISTAYYNAKGVQVPAPGSANVGQLVPKGYTPSADQVLVKTGGRAKVLNRYNQLVNVKMYRVESVARQVILSVQPAPVYYAPPSVGLYTPPAAAQVTRSGHVAVGSANNAPASGYLGGRHVTNMAVNGGGPRGCPIDPRSGRPVLPH